MKSIVFLGTDFKKSKGGIASLLEEYANLFPGAIFLSTTRSSGSHFNLFIFIKALFYFIFILIKTKIDIIHIHGSSYNSFYRKSVFFILSKIFEGKIVYHIHSGQFHVFYKSANGISKFLIKKVINNSDCIVCLTDGWKQYVLQNFKPKMVRVIPNIITKPKICKRKNKDCLSFLFLGKIGHNKGIWDLLEVIIENKEKLQSKAMFYVGGNGDTQKLVRLIEEYKLEEMVEFIGWVSRDKKAEYLNKSDVYILPSYIEGLPISILEAMSYGLPIISTRVGGIPEIVENDQNGLLIEPGSKEQLIDAIFYAIDNPKKLQNYSKVSKNKVDGHFPESVKEKLLDLYQIISKD